MKKKRFNSNIKKQEVLEFVTNFIKENNYSPSYEEIAESLKITQCYSFRLVKKLIEEGIIIKNKDSSIRSLSIK
jgi:predicted transcriptional regulator